mgnify:FL=1
MPDNSVGFLTKYGFMMDFNVFKRNIYVKKPICNIGESFCNIIGM